MGRLARFMPVAAVGMGLSMALAQPADAVTLSVGQTANFTINCGAGETCNGDTPTGLLQVEGDVTLLALTSNSATLKFNVENTGNVVGNDVTSIGIATDPGTTSAAFAVSGEGNLFDSIGGGAIPGFSDLNTCVTLSGNCQSVGNNDGLSIGDTDMFTLVLQLESDPGNSLDILSIGAKFARFGGSSQARGDLTVIPVPTPLLLLVSAVAGLGLLNWRRKVF